MTGLSLYKLLFVAELLIAEGICTFRMQRRKYFVIRLLVSLAVCFLVAFFFPVVEISYTGWYTSLMFLILFFLTLCGVLACFKISFKNAFFCATVAYTAQHLSYEIFKLVLMPFDILVANNLYGDSIIDLSKMSNTTVIVMLVYFDICLVVYAVTYFIIGKKLRGGDLRLKNTSMLILSAVILLVDIILNAVVVYIDSSYNEAYDIVVGVYNSLCCLLVFYILHNVIEVKDIKDELETVSHLLEQAKKQFQLKKNEINLINIKCHDLKHQIAQYALRGGLDGETVAEIKQLISIYDANVKTGNEVLDIILTEKSLVCQENDIKLTCMAECEDLDFISDGELYALFGNIFDNAIEAVAQVENPEDRCISLNVHKEGDFISAMAENYYAEEIKFNSDGLPASKKEDKDNHGFGLKSIKAIVEKYGGDLSISVKDRLFRLNILLPIQKNRKKKKSIFKAN